MFVRTSREIIVLDEQEQAAKPTRRAYPARRVHEMTVYLQRAQGRRLNAKAGSRTRASAVLRLLVRMVIRGSVDVSEEDISAELGHSLGDNERRRVYMSGSQFQQFVSAVRGSPGKNNRTAAAVRVMVGRYLNGQIRISSDEIDLEIRRAARRTRSR